MAAALGKCEAGKRPRKAARSFCPRYAGFKSPKLKSAALISSIPPIPLEGKSPELNSSGFNSLELTSFGFTPAKFSFPETGDFGFSIEEDVSCPLNLCREKTAHNTSPHSSSGRPHNSIPEKPNLSDASFTRGSETLTPPQIIVSSILPNTSRRAEEISSMISGAVRWA